MKSEIVYFNRMASVIGLALLLNSPWARGNTGEAEPYTFATLQTAYGYADGPLAVAKINPPGSIAVDIAGNIFFADTENHLIRKITADGLVTTVAGTYREAGWKDGLGGEARFNNPRGLCIDNEGNAYVADSGNHIIRKITADGTVTTIAGQSGSSHYADGRGASAGFFSPRGIDVDAAGNLFIADTGNNVLRKVTPSGMTFTLAGLAGQPGSADGSGNSARFSQLQGVAVGSDGTIYIADTANRTIRVASPTGTVRTLAGRAGESGSADGIGNAARFGKFESNDGPTGVAVDHNGNVFVADRWNGTIRKITPAGLVTTIGGLAGNAGKEDGTGADARFFDPTHLAVDSAGILYVAGKWNNAIRKGFPSVGAPVVRSQPEAQQVERNPGTEVNFRVAVSGAQPMLYQWRKAGVPIDGATNSALTLQNLQASDDAAYTVTASNSFGSAESSTAPLTTFVRPPAASELPAPLDRMISQTYSYTFWANLSGTAPLSYQWRKDGTNIPGATNEFYEIASAHVSDTGKYSVAATNAYGSVISPGPALTVRASAPFTFTKLAGGTRSYDEAGGGTYWGEGSADGKGDDARFRFTFVFGGGSADLALGPDGNLYVTDSGNNTIRKVTRDGVVTTLAGKAPALDFEDTSSSVDGRGSDARFRTPTGIAVDRSGSIYVADSENLTIRKITPEGVVSTIAGEAGAWGDADGQGSAARFAGPTRLAVDRLGSVYVSDYYRIRKVTPDGVVTTIAGQYNAGGHKDGPAQQALFQPLSGIAVDDLLNIYVADPGNAVIRKITPEGMVSTWTAAIFGKPEGITLDREGNLYVADPGYNLISKVGRDGEVSTLAGKTFISNGWGDVLGGFVNGTGSSARFDGPYGIAADDTGALYVADVFNHMIRKGVPAPYIMSARPGFGFSASGFGFDLAAGEVVEASGDLVLWQPIWTNSASAHFRFRDLRPASSTNQFYRARLR